MGKYELKMNIILGGADKAINSTKSLNSQFKKLKGQTEITNKVIQKQISLYRLQTSVFAKMKNLGITNKNIQKMDINALNKYNAVLDRKNRLTIRSTNVFKANRGALMGIGFAALFGGMALKRVFTGALKGIFKGMKEIYGETSEFNVMTNQLTGAWEFFKFTLVDALMQTGLFQSFMTWLIGIVNWMGKFTAEHPKIAAMVIPFLAIGAALSSILMIAGQVGLALLSWKMLDINTLSSTEKLLKSITNNSINLKDAWKKLIEKGQGLGNVMTNEIIKSIKWLKANPWRTFAAAGLLTGIILVAAWLIKVTDSMGGIGHTWDNVKRGFMNGLAMMAAGLASLFNMIKYRTLDFTGLYSTQLEANLAKVAEDFGTPYGGYRDVSIKDIISGELEPANEEAKKYLMEQANEQSAAQVELLNKNNEILSSIASQGTGEITFGRISSSVTQ